jgi:hypothetical protein
MRRMSLRLPHVLALMALILAAGVLSVQQLEAHVGKTAVPGLLLVEAPGMGFDEAGALARRWPGATLEWVAAEEGPLAPFDSGPVTRMRTRGWASVLVAPRAAATPPGEADAEAALRRKWGALVTELPADDAPARLAEFVATHTGARPFIAGFVRRDPSVAELLGTLAPLVAAAEALPSFRRTSIVVLGLHEPESRRRLALRIDRGPPSKASSRALLDLLGAGE